MTEIDATTAPTHDDPVASVASRATSLRRIGAAVVAVPTAVATLVVAFIAGPLPGVATLAVVGVALAVAWRSISVRPEQSVLAMFPSEPVDPVRHARLVNVVDGLSLVSGTSRPELRVCAGSHPFAMALAGAGDSGVIVVSDGAVARWGRMETEAVAAHLLFRLRSGDAALTTRVLAVSIALPRLAEPFGRWIRAKTLDGTFVLSADLAACRMTRYPPAMVAALESLVGVDDNEVSVAVEVPDVLAPLCFSRAGNDTTAESGFPSVEAFHPPVADRIALCKEI